MHNSNLQYKMKDVDINVRCSFLDKKGARGDYEKGHFKAVKWAPTAVIRALIALISGIISMMRSYDL